MVIVYAFILLLLIICLHTIYQYQIKIPNLPGPKFVFPLLGQIINIVLSPYNFWVTQESYGPLSKNFFAGQLMIFSAKSEYTNYIFKKKTTEKTCVSSSV